MPRPRHALAEAEPCQARYDARAALAVANADRLRLENEARATAAQTEAGRAEGGSRCADRLPLQLRPIA